MTSKESLDIIKQRVNTIRLNTKIGSRRIADEENAVLLDHIEYNLNKLCELVEKQEKLLELYQELDKINGWLLLCFTIGGEETEKEYNQLGGGNRRHELIKQIKELENDR